MSRHIDHQHEAMFAYYTAARWFGITLDLVLGIFCAIVGLMELYTVKDSSTASMSFQINVLCHINSVEVEKLNEYLKFYCLY